MFTETEGLGCYKKSSMSLTWVVPNRQFHWLSQVLSVFFCSAGTATSLGEAKGTTNYQGAWLPGSTAGTADRLIMGISALGVRWSQNQ